MNKETGAIGLGIRISFHDKYFNQELANLEGYSISMVSNKPDGWLLFSGNDDARGPWLFMDMDELEDKVEDLGEL